VAGWAGESEQSGPVSVSLMNGWYRALEGHRGRFGLALKHLLLVLLWLADLVVPKRDLVVVRTFPDFDDQGREFVRVWGQVHPHVPVVWLTEGDPGAVPPAVAQLGVRCRSASSAAGLWAYLRANLVVHTKGLYGLPRRSNAKYFVNLWHGMPVKRLYPNPPLAQRQTDLLTVTSQVHRGNLSTTWDLPEDRIIIGGLPRGDRLLRASAEPVPEALAAEARGRRLCLWLPTYRIASSRREHRDGRDFGNVFQLPGATPEAVAAMFDAHGLHAIVKPHPMADTHESISLPGLTVWGEDDLAARDLTLCEVLGHAELLLTDHSSIWIDYLLLGRPIIYTIGDREDYAESRGHYFTPLEEHLPGPLVDTLEGLRGVLATPFDDLRRTWAPSLKSSQAFHHEYVDDRSAERIVAYVTPRWRQRSSGSLDDRRLTAQRLSPSEPPRK
jgi:CDP-glycerol glycerophosphotransferase (TagB/SpsB family)